MKELDEYFSSNSSLIWDGDFTIVKILGQTKDFHNGKIQNFVTS